MEMLNNLNKSWLKMQACSTRQEEMEIEAQFIIKLHTDLGMYRNAESE